MISKLAAQPKECCSRLAARLKECCSKLAARLKEFCSKLAVCLKECSSKLAAQPKECCSKLAAQPKECCLKLAVRLKECCSKLAVHLKECCSKLAPQPKECCSKLAAQLGKKIRKSELLGQYLHVSGPLILYNIRQTTLHSIYISKTSENLSFPKTVFWWYSTIGVKQFILLKTVLQTADSVFDFTFTAGNPTRSALDQKRMSYSSIV